MSIEDVDILEIFPPGGSETLKSKNKTILSTGFDANPIDKQKNEKKKQTRQNNEKNTQQTWSFFLKINVKAKYNLPN